jgi:general stress protein 26
MTSTVRIPCCIALVALLVAAQPAGTPAQEPKADAHDREALIAAARELMATQKYCALITVDAAGRPSVRTMNPFPPDEDMAVYFATNDRSRKAEEIRRDPRVSLYYGDHQQAIGYVVLTGRALLIDDMQEILKRKRDYWDQAFPGLKNLVLIKVVPEKLDILYYKRGLNGDSVTWRTPSADLSGPVAKPEGKP